MSVRTHIIQLKKQAVRLLNWVAELLLESSCGRTVWPAAQSLPSVGCAKLKLPVLCVKLTPQN